MITALGAHADSMTQLYRSLNQMISDQCNDEASYADLFAKAAQYSSWYKSRKRVALTMKTAAAPSA